MSEKNPLTPRELQVAGALAEGLSNQEIATKLGIARETVKEYVANCMKKLNFDNRTRVAIWFDRLQRQSDREKQLVEELAVTDQLMRSYQSALRLIPECPQHGFCLQHYKTWILLAREKYPELAEEAEAKSQTEIAAQEAETAQAISGAGS